MSSTTADILNSLIWRPKYLESADGLPLATIVMDFFAFDYRNLTNDPLLAFFLRPEAMIALVLFYLFTLRPMREAVDTFNLNPKSKAFKTFLALHNLGLAIFSAVSMWNFWLLWSLSVVENGWYIAFCDQDGNIWRDGLGSWTNFFYLSKFYEFIDTWILIYKRKKPSLLQVYHHAGVVMTMWGAVVSQSPWLPLASAVNSFIHTLMYTYFFIKTIKPDAEIKIAKYLTMLQIFQFFMGLCFSIFYYKLGRACDSQSSRFVCIMSGVYVTILMGLFVSFANKKYAKPTDKKPKSV